LASSIYLAKLIGPVALAVGLALAFNAATFRAMANEFLTSHALIFVSGFLTLVAGVAILLAHNVWTADWRVIITLIGWLAIITGAIRLIAPERAAAFGRPMLQKPHTLQIGAAIWLIVGAALCYFGYIH
jgi:hypothetical protein